MRVTKLLREGRDGFTSPGETQGGESLDLWGQGWDQRLREALINPEDGCGVGSAQQESCQGLPWFPRWQWLSQLSPDLVFDQPVLVVPDGAALLAQAGDHHPPCLHLLHIVGHREEELQLPAPDVEIDPSLQERSLVCTHTPLACSSSPGWGSAGEDPVPLGGFSPSCCRQVPPGVPRAVAVAVTCPS